MSRFGFSDAAARAASQARMMAEAEKLERERFRQLREEGARARAEEGDRAPEPDDRPSPRAQWDEVRACWVEWDDAAGDWVIVGSPAPQDGVSASIAAAGPDDDGPGDGAPPSADLPAGWSLDDIE